MEETRKAEGSPGARGGTVGRPVVSIVALFLLVAGLSWTGAEAPPAAVVRIENRAAEARAVDVVWTGAGGKASGSLLRVVEPAGTLIHPVRVGTTACVRWIDGGSGSVEAAWPVPASTGSRTIRLPTGSVRASPPGPCPPELLEHRVRPRPGRWMVPGQPGREYRERVIPRAPRRRIARRRRSKGRGRGLPGLLDRLWRPAGRTGSRRVTRWHLTPRGWIRGGWRSRELEHPDRPPDDRVMTCAFVAERPTRFVRPRSRVVTLWIGDAVYARRLTRRFGRCPWSH